MTEKRDHISTISAIRNCVGKTVSDVARVQYYFNDQEDNDGFGDLEITFDDKSHLTLTGIGDAESIKADNKKAEIYKTYNVTENDVASWKRLDLKDDKNWKNIIGQTLQTAEVEWNIYQDIDDRIVACVLHFDTDFVTFFETNSDTNKFYVNKPLPLVNRQTKIENIK
jgi:hypothetical protein